MKAKYILLLTLAIVVVLLCAASCRAVKKDSSTESSIKDTASLTKATTGQVLKNDSVNIAQTVMSYKKESKTTESSGVKVTFKDDAAGSKAPVTIKENADGSVTVDPGGRQLESVTTRNKKKEQKKDSTGTQQKKIIKTGSVDSNYQVKLDSSAGHWVKTKTTESVEKKAPIPWYVWLIGFVFITASAVVAYKSFIKRKIV